MDVPGGKSVVGVDFSPATNRDEELADPGRMRRQLKENPHIVDEPVLDYGSLPPLLTAAHKGYFETVDLLLGYGADADATDHSGRTLLQRLTASQNNRLCAASSLTAASADLSTALSMGDAELVRQLVAADGRWLNLLDDATGEASGQAPLFDGSTLDDWTPTSDQWKIENGEIVCPTSDRIQFMISHHVVDRPFSLRYQLSAIERSRHDGKMLGVIDAAGNGVLATIDDEIEHTVQIASGRRSFDDNGVYGQWQLEATTELQMQLGKWYDILLTLDGKQFTVSAGDSEISCPFEPQFPVFIWLEVQRTGAKYRDLYVSLR